MCAEVEGCVAAYNNLHIPLHFLGTGLIVSAFHALIIQEQTAVGIVESFPRRTLFVA
jgi:hypothetical protein